MAPFGRNPTEYLKHIFTVMSLCARHSFVLSLFLVKDQNGFGSVLASAAMDASNFLLFFRRRVLTLLDALLNFNLASSGLPQRRDDIHLLWQACFSCIAILVSLSMGKPLTLFQCGVDVFVFGTNLFCKSCIFDLKESQSSDSGLQLDVDRNDSDQFSSDS